MQSLFSKNKSKNSQELNQTQIKPKFKIIYLYIFVICLGLFIGNFAFNHFLYPKIIATPKKEISNQIKQSNPPLTVNQIPPAVIINTADSEKPVVVPEPAVVPEPVLVLNGVFFEKDFGYALINNQIVKTGDTINQAKIKMISLDGVELDFFGKKIKLSKPT